MQQYLDLCRRIIETGTWVTNTRTGKRCLTVIDASLTYDCRGHRIPLLTTRKVPWRSAVAEILGYWKGFDSAAQFRELGCPTWDANANHNRQWLANPHRKGTDDMGRSYGPQIRRWQTPDGREIDQLRKVYDDLRHGIDDRREIITFHNPGEEDRMCLPACMHTHTFSILNGMLHLTSYQRSSDVPLGQVFNQIQVAWLLLVMSRITGLKPGFAYHKIVNAHIYEDQLDILRTQHLTRTVQHPSPILTIAPHIKTLEDVDRAVVDDFAVVDYQHQGRIEYPFSV